MNNSMRNPLEWGFPWQAVRSPHSADEEDNPWDYQNHFKYPSLRTLLMLCSGFI